MRVFLQFGGSGGRGDEKYRVGDEVEPVPVDIY
jgi:hypothetical protein